jgi:hypothetical protein
MVAKTQEREVPVFLHVDKLGFIYMIAFSSVRTAAKPRHAKRDG